MVGTWSRQRGPDNAVARHMIASATGEGTPQRCDYDYVRGTFDQDFANSCGMQLERIEYKVPELVGEAIKSLGIDRTDLDVLGVGYGMRPSG